MIITAIIVRQELAVSNQDILLNYCPGFLKFSREIMKGISKIIFSVRFYLFKYTFFESSHKAVN